MLSLSILSNKQCFVYSIVLLFSIYLLFFIISVEQMASVAFHQSSRLHTQSHQGKHSAVKHQIEQCCTHRAERAKSALVLSNSLLFISLLAVCFSQRAVQNKWPACTHLVPQKEGLCPLPWGHRYSSGVATCHMKHMLKQNKGTHIKSETGKYISIQDI